MTSEEEEEPVRLNILLSKHALGKLEWLKKYGGFGSRGRTIEEAILAIEDMMTYVGLYMSLRNEKNPMSFEDFRNCMLMIIMRLGKFGLFTILKEAKEKEK